MWMDKRYAYVVKVLLLLVSLALLRQPAPVSAAEIHGRSSTQFIWYNDSLDGGNQKSLSEYLQVTMTGLDSAGKLSIQGYGRAVYDVKNGGEVADRIYYLYADYKNLLDRADVRIGRQFVNFSAGSSLMDGVQVDVKNVGPVGFTLAGGRDISFGESDTLTSHASAAGFSAYLAGYKNTELDISYFRKYDYTNISADTIGANFTQYLLDSVKLYANARYDLTAEATSEALAGVKYFPFLDLMLSAEYYESYPTFDSTSIYSVFAVDKYKERAFTGEYTIISWLDLSASYYHELYGEDSRAGVYELGFKVRPGISTTVSLYRDGRRGYYGELDGYKISVEYSKFGKWKMAAGYDHDVYERDNSTGEETAKKYWVSGKYIFAKNMSSSFRVEDNVNITYSKDMRGKVAFDYEF